MIVLFLCFRYLKAQGNEFKELKGIIRVVVALAAAGVSISLPGFVDVETQKTSSQTMWPRIKAGGALAIFVLVYLFDPVNQVAS